MSKFTIFKNSELLISRQSQYYLVELLCPHRVLSTSHLQGGRRDDLQYLLNYQSCEAAGHMDRHEYMSQLGREGMHQEACQFAECEPTLTAMMGTAADMQYASMYSESYEDTEVRAVVTAGVQGNASTAGDPALWHEFNQQWKMIPGTINTMLFFNVELSEAALARAVMTMVEAKSALLNDLQVGSRYSERIATGTGTDQYCIAAPIGRGDCKTWSGAHSKLGELIGRVVYQATAEALKWQNGLENSMSRDVFHALKRFGVHEEWFQNKLADYVGEQTPPLEFFVKNLNSIRYNPVVTSLARAWAGVMDQQRVGQSPESLFPEQWAYQAALMTTELARYPEGFAQFLEQFSQMDSPDWREYLFKAMVLGWEFKWKKQEDPNGNS